jgi:hypothetical protein
VVGVMATIACDIITQDGRRKTSGKDHCIVMHATTDEMSTSASFFATADWRLDLHHFVLENSGIPVPFRIQTNSLKVLDLEFQVLDEIISRYKPEKNSHLNNEQPSFTKYILSPRTTAQYKQHFGNDGGMREVLRRDKVAIHVLK